MPTTTRAAVQRRRHHRSLHRALRADPGAAAGRGGAAGAAPDSAAAAGRGRGRGAIRQRRFRVASPAASSTPIGMHKTTATPDGQVQSNVDELYRVVARTREPAHLYPRHHQRGHHRSHADWQPDTFRGVSRLSAYGTAGGKRTAFVRIPDSTADDHHSHERRDRRRKGHRRQDHRAVVVLEVMVILSERLCENSQLGDDLLFVAWSSGRINKLNANWANSFGLGEFFRMKSG